MELDDVSRINHRQFLERLVVDLKQAFPQRRYNSSHKIELIMEKEGNQAVIDYIVRKFIKGTGQ